MRCYNGCPDKELQAVLDLNKFIDQQLCDIGMRAVFFPKEEAYMVFKDLEPVTNNFHSTKRDAAEEAIAKHKRRMQCLK